MSEPTDIGDAADVPEDQRVDIDAPEPNEDAGDLLDDLDPGVFVDLTVVA